MRFAPGLSARFALPLSLSLGLGALSFTGCVNEVSGPSNIAIDDVHGAVEGAIDGDADVEIVQSGPWEVVVLSGVAANQLYAAMDDAGGFAPESKNGLSYLYGRYTLCVTNGAASACHLYTRGTNSQEGYSVTFFGNRFDSAAGELFGTVARAQGIDPRDVTQTSIGRFDCIKGQTDAGCGVRQPESDAPMMGDDLRPLTVDLNGPDLIISGTRELTGDCYTGTRRLVHCHAVLQNGDARAQGYRGTVQYADAVWDLALLWALRIPGDTEFGPCEVGALATRRGPR